MCARPALADLAAEVFYGWPKRIITMRTESSLHSTLRALIEERLLVPRALPWKSVRFHSATVRVSWRPVADCAAVDLHMVCSTLLSVGGPPL